MPEFLKLVSPAAALSTLLSAIDLPIGDVEVVATTDALHRVTASDVAAPHALPEFSRSTVDGFAVKARETHGASSSQPAYLRLVGEVLMGTRPAFVVGAGRCALIHTGGMLPEGADAVVMLEHASRFEASDRPAGPAQEIEVLRPAAPNENVIQTGEDVKPGQTAIRAGTRLRPAEIAGLMALGLTAVTVRRKPIVALISSGDEVISPTAKPEFGQVRDVNGPGLAALVTEAGGLPRFHGIVPDDRVQLEALARNAISNSDVIVITAGSSASARDLTAEAISSLGVPGVLVHGINIRPGKPTILGACGGKPVLGLPGNPVSAMVVARLIIMPVIAALQGLPRHEPRARVAARLSVNLASQAGREDWWPVRLIAHADASESWDAEPIFGRSNLIFSLAAADGLLCIPAPLNGLEAGAEVEVEPL